MTTPLMPGTSCKAFTDHWNGGPCASGAGDRDTRRPRLARRRRIRSCSAKMTSPMCGRSRRRSGWRQQPRRCSKRAALNTTHDRRDMTSHLDGLANGLDGTRLQSGQTRSGTPRTSRRLCGSLVFGARMRRARSTVASRLVRKVPDEGMDARCNKGRPGSTHTLRTGVPAPTAQAARFGYAGGWLGRLLNAFAG